MNSRLENKDEGKRKSRRQCNFFQTNLLRRRKENFRQSTKQECFGKAMVKI